jgi:hypothetical protein
MDAVAAQDVRHNRVRSSRVVLISRRKTTGARKPGTPRRARSSRKTIAQGVPCDSALPDDLWAFFLFSPRGLRVRLSARHSLRPLFRGATVSCITRTQITPRERRRLFITISSSGLLGALVIVPG